MGELARRVYLFIVHNGKVLLDKSLFYVLANVYHNVANDNSRKKGMPLMTNLDKYLKMPALYGRVLKNIYKH